MNQNLVALIAGVSISLATPFSAEAEPDFRDGSSAIFPADRAELLLEQCSRPTPRGVTGTWTPTPEQISELEPKLAELIDAHLSDRPRLRLSHENYGRQYGGLVLDGQKVIYINGVYDRKTNWQGEPTSIDYSQQIFVCDGGASYFGVVYDVEAGVFSDFYFNGHG